MMKKNVKQHVACWNDIIDLCFGVLETGKKGRWIDEMSMTVGICWEDWCVNDSVKRRSKTDLMNSMRYHSKIDALLGCPAPLNLRSIPEPSFFLQNFHPCLPLNLLDLLSSFLFGPPHHVFLVIILQLACGTAVATSREPEVFVLVFFALPVVGLSDLVWGSVCVFVDESALGLAESLQSGLCLWLSVGFRDVWRVLFQDLRDVCTSSWRAWSP